MIRFIRNFMNISHVSNIPQNKLWIISGKKFNEINHDKQYVTYSAENSLYKITQKCKCIHTFKCVPNCGLYLYSTIYTGYIWFYRGLFAVISPHSFLYFVFIFFLTLLSTSSTTISFLYLLLSFFLNSICFFFVIFANAFIMCNLDEFTSRGAIYSHLSHLYISALPTSFF